MTSPVYTEFYDDLIDSISQTTLRSRVDQLWLGGTGGPNGGAGSRPGGFIGQLNQSLVSYDTTEAAIPSGSGSLLDNLNHIRYNIATISGSIPSFTVQDYDLSPSYTDINTLRFSGASISNPSPHVALVTISGSNTITVQDYDLSPSYANTSTLRFSGATVSSPSPNVTLVTISGSTALTVQDYDLNPSYSSINTIRFSGAELSNPSSNVTLVTIPGMTVKEADNTPTLTDINILTFSGGFIVTNPSSREARIELLQADASFTVQDYDLNPSYENINTLRFSGAALSNPSPNVALITFSGSGGVSGDFVSKAGDTMTGKLLVNDDVYIAQELELDGSLNHDGSTVGFFGATPVTQSIGWYINSWAETKALEITSTSLDELANIVATMINYLKDVGIFGE